MMMMNRNFLQEVQELEITIVIVPTSTCPRFNPFIFISIERVAESFCKDI